MIFENPIARTQNTIFPKKLSVMFLAIPISETCQIRAMIKPLMKNAVMSPLNPIVKGTSPSVWIVEVCEEPSFSEEDEVELPEVSRVAEIEVSRFREYGFSLVLSRTLRKRKFRLLRK